MLFDLFGAQRTRELMAELDENRVYRLTGEELASLQAVFAADYAETPRSRSTSARPSATTAT